MALRGILRGGRLRLSGHSFFLDKITPFRDIHVVLWMQLTNVTIYCNYTIVLLDTATEATLEWTRYPFGPEATTPGVS
ncbi:hypothetical protein PGB90_010040 [Kerria lacca]